jgi:aldose 1-epimerase
MKVSSFTLTNDSLRCEIVPAMGGAIAGLWLGEIPVLRARPPSEWTTARQASCYALLPFSNRIGHATMTWAGVMHCLSSSAGDEPHAIHGVGWQRPWQVQMAEARCARLSLQHQADAAWPFAFDAEQSFRLSANELELTLSIRNLADLAVPVGLGWHPFFVKRKHSRISFDAKARWEMNAEKLPTQRVPVSGLSTYCGSLDIDHCFDGWSGVVQLQDELLHTSITSNLNHLVVYTQPRQAFVAIEPVSHVNNAIQLMAQTGASAAELGVQVLQPGASMSAKMRIQVQRAP